MDQVNNPALEMMLPMAITVIGHKRERKMFHSRPTSNDWFESSYTIRLQFQNTTIETDIHEGDTRYDLIKEHLAKNGVIL